MLVEKVLFTKEECDKIINLKKDTLQKWKNNDREYFSESIKFDNGTEWIFLKLKKFFEEEYGSSMVKLKEEIHFHKFTKNNWFGVHNDTRDNRLFSVGVLLNDDFEGGDFKLYKDGETTLNKKTGNSYIFDVSISHEVTPINFGNRYSLIWFIQNNHIRTSPKKML
jgi:predicted 2-oxoglutarate/Fe(II)-dependent dioxygenase YbiX